MISDLDTARFRAETAGIKNVLHFNNAGASLPPDAVYDRVVSHLARERSIGGYEAKSEAAAEFDEFYDVIAQLVGARSSEIAFIENATRAWDMAFYSLPLAQGDEIISVEAEYASNYLAYLQAAKKRGVIIRVARSDQHGQLDIGHLEKLVNKRTKLISLTHVPSQSGLINPAEDVGRIAKQHGILYLLDACQSVGQLPIDVRKIGCDMLSSTGRKFLRGPRGTGFLYIKESLANSLEPVMIDLHAARWTGPDKYEIEPGARRFENWECFYAGKLGLAVAARYAMSIGLEDIARRNASLSNRLRTALGGVPGVEITDPGLKRSAIVTFKVKNMDSVVVGEALRAKRINTSVSPASYAQLDLPRRGHTSLVRASVHYYNNEDEVDELARAVAQLAGAQNGSA